MSRRIPLPRVTRGLSRADRKLLPDLRWDCSLATQFIGLTVELLSTGPATSRQHARDLRGAAVMLDRYATATPKGRQAIRQCVAAIAREHKGGRR